MEMPTHHRFQNLMGMKMHRLTVTAFEGKRGDSYWWTCQCDCGNTTSLASKDFNIGHTQSCGCARVERSREWGASKELHVSTTTHGHSPRKGYDLTYHSWEAMKARCYNPATINYDNYGGRGISVCARWRDGENGVSGFQCFLDDMGPRLDKKLTLDRFPDGNGNYEPSNCRWATGKQQIAGRTKTNKVLTQGQVDKIRQEYIASKIGRKNAPRGWVDAKAAEYSVNVGTLKQILIGNGYGAREWDGVNNKWAAD